mmetsp:Transcript_86855/g.187918  ORF Transcript_86855/g.187918 Transcript_86855/m.187918 type:complete len:107 (-) Transcript_86855:1471-1791(-)
MVHTIHEPLLQVKMTIPKGKPNTSFKEFIFVVDRSGSMRGAFMDLAKQALKLSLKSLPVKAYFNVMSFGTRIEWASPNMLEYNKQNLNSILAKVEGMSANFGGTDL